MLKLSDYHSRPLDSGLLPPALSDSFMVAKIRSLIEQFRIQVAVETGTYAGGSTVMLADMVSFVYGVEAYEPLVQMTIQNVIKHQKTNVAICPGNSPDVLQRLVPTLPKETLFLLDSHWCHYWPLLDEIRALRKGCGIIVLHDIQVPDKPHLGYMKDYGQVLNYAHVQQALTEWSPNHKIEYGEESDNLSGRPGVAYITPK